MPRNGYGEQNNKTATKLTTSKPTSHHYLIDDELSAEPDPTHSNRAEPSRAKPSRAEPNRLTMGVVDEV